MRIRRRKRDTINDFLQYNNRNEKYIRCHMKPIKSDGRIGLQERVDF